VRYSIFKDKKISSLGFGAMRFPMKEEGGEKVVDRELTEKMLSRAIEAGINYFDTAWPYHGGESERILGELLSRYPRESYFLADKYPGHQVMEHHDPAAIFEEQLRRLKTDYIDFYLLHNVCESSMDTYLDENIGIIDYFLEQKRLGRIKHLGFSSHASLEGLKRFIDAVGDKMEFCQIQLNYLDYTLQRAGEKLDFLNKRGIPVWVMEPVRGGKLARLPESAEAELRARRPDESTASFAFRYLMTLEGVTVTLSGMSDMSQLEDNIRTYSGGTPLSEDEVALLYRFAEGLKASVPCTACRYCTEGCPVGLDIPALLEVYNELRVNPTSVNTGMRVEFLPEEKKPSGCISCGACAGICPQKIDIPARLSDLKELLLSVPSWRAICKQRDEEQKKNASR